MAKVITANTGSKFLTLSTSAWAALANVAVVTLGAASNTNMELIASQWISSGLRWHKEQRLSHGQATDAGITGAYLDSVKANSE